MARLWTLHGWSTNGWTRNYFQTKVGHLRLPLNSNRLLPELFSKLRRLSSSFGLGLLLFVACKYKGITILQSFFPVWLLSNSYLLRILDVSFYLLLSHALPFPPLSTYLYTSVCIVETILKLCFFTRATFEIFTLSDWRRLKYLRRGKKILNHEKKILSRTIRDDITLK